MLEHHAVRIVGDDLADHRGREDHREGQRIVLENPRHIRPDGFSRLLVIADDLVVGAKRGRRRDHDTGSTGVHRCPRQRAHGGKARCGDADDHLHFLGALDEAHRHLLGFSGVELRGFTEDAEHRDAVAADLLVEIGQAVDRALVDPAVIVERRRRDCEGALGVGGELHQSFSLSPSFRDVRSTNPESRGSGFDASHRPGTTTMARTAAPPS